MRTVNLLLIATLLVVGCATQKQRTYVRFPDGTKVYCTQRNTLLALFGENQELHKMSGMCGVFEGDSSNVGFNEEGRKALEGAVEAGVCAAIPGSCVVGGLLDGDAEEE